MALSSDTKLIVKTSTLSAVFTLILLVLFNYILNHTFVLGATNANPPITVQGTGTVSAQPDESTVDFTVSETATALTDAQNQANTSVNKMVSDLQKLGIDKKDIQTSNYNSEPNYSDTSGASGGGIQPMMVVRPPTNQNGIDNYTVSEDITVTLTDVTKANSVIDTVTKDGAQNISGPSLSFSDAKQQDLENQARAKAIANAREKAQSMAQAAGVHLGKLTKIQDDDQTPYPIFRPIMMSAMGTAAKAAPTQINPGQNQVSANVTLSYQTY